MKVVPMPPRGRYLAHDAGRLAGVSGKRIGQWARHGLIRSSQSNESPRVYSFQDVAEAMAVHELVERGFTPAIIRRSISGLRKEYGDWPLQFAEVHVPVTTLTGFATGTRTPRTIAVKKRGKLYDAADPAQELMLGTSDLQRIVFDLRRGGWAARKLADLRYIEVDPDRMSGRPTIKGLRLPVEDVVALAGTDDGLAELHEDFGLSTAQIRDAVRWWEATNEYERAA